MASKVPSFTFKKSDGSNASCSSELIGSTWYIYLLESGIFKFANSKSSVDIFLQGGGGSGGGNDIASKHGFAGGTGGYQSNQYGKSISNTEYSITIGSGGYGNRSAYTNAGGATSGFGFSASGGKGAVWNGQSVPSTEGTSAGGKGGWYNDGSNSGEPGTAGSNGKRPFGASAGSSYASWYYGAGGGGGGCKVSWGASGGTTGGGAGGGGGNNGSAATANSGSGGGGAGGDDGGVYRYGGSGGSGIIILRGTEDDFLPITYNGVQLGSITFNGTKITSLYYNGTKIF